MSKRETYRQINMRKLSLFLNDFVVVRRLYNLLYLVCVLLPGLAMAQPTANFTANNVSGCSPIVVQFTDQSTGGATSWSWNLGNGSNSTLQNPSTTYITPGTYTV